MNHNNTFNQTNQTTLTSPHLSSPATTTQTLHLANASSHRPPPNLPPTPAPMEPITPDYSVSSADEMNWTGRRKSSTPSTPQSATSPGQTNSIRRLHQQQPGGGAQLPSALTSTSPMATAVLPDEFPSRARSFSDVDMEHNHNIDHDHMNQKMQLTSDIAMIPMTVVAPRPKPLIPHPEQFDDPMEEVSVEPLMDDHYSPPSSSTSSTSSHSSDSTSPPTLTKKQLKQLNQHAASEAAAMGATLRSSPTQPPLTTFQLAPHPASKHFKRSSQQHHFPDTNYEQDDHQVSDSSNRENMNLPAEFAPNSLPRQHHSAFQKRAHQSQQRSNSLAAAHHQHQLWLHTQQHRPNVQPTLTQHRLELPSSTSDLSSSGSSPGLTSLKSPQSTSSNSPPENSSSPTHPLPPTHPFSPSNLNLRLHKHRSSQGGSTGPVSTVAQLTPSHSKGGSSDSSDEMNQLQLELEPSSDSHRSSGPESGSGGGPSNFNWTQTTTGSVSGPEGSLSHMSGSSDEDSSPMMMRSRPPSKDGKSHPPTDWQHLPVSPCPSDISSDEDVPRAMAEKEKLHRLTQSARALKIQVAPIQSVRKTAIVPPSHASPNSNSSNNSSDNSRNGDPASWHTM